MDGAGDTHWSVWNDRHEQNARENPHLYLWRSTLSSDSDSSENGSSIHVSDEMHGLEYPHPPPSTPAGSEIVVHGDDNVSDNDSDITYGYISSALRFTPPNGQKDAPTGAQFGVNSVQAWWARPHVLVFDEFEIKMVHSAILYIIEKEEEQRKAPKIAKEEAEKKQAQLQAEIGKANFAKALVDIGFMTEKEFEEAKRRAMVRTEKELEEQEAKECARRDNEVKLDVAKKTTDNLIFTAADKKTPKDAFIEGRRVGRLLFWRAIEGEDEYVDAQLSVYSRTLECLVPRLCQTALKQKNPVVALAFVGGIKHEYRKLAKKIPQDLPTTGSPRRDSGSYELSTGE